MAAQKQVSVANRTYGMSYQTLFDFGTNVVAAMTAAVAVFVAPTPALADITTALTSLQTSITLWGVKGNRGSHAELVALRAARNLVRSLLEQESSYVQGVARSLSSVPEDEKDTILLAGMRPKDDANTLPIPNAPVNARQLVRQKYLSTKKIFMKWKKPLVDPGSNSKPAFYIVSVSATPTGTFNQTAQTIKTSLVYEASNNDTIYFKVVAVNAAGTSGNSDIIVGVPQ